MSILLPTVSAVLSVISFFLMLRDIDIHREQFYPTVDDNEKIRRLSVPAVVFSVLMLLLTIAVSVLFNTIYQENGILLNIKRVALLSIIWPIAYIDLKTYRIPNAFIIYGLLCRVVIFAFEVLFATDSVGYTIITELVAMAAMLLASGLCSLCVKNSIGFGDIKMFIVMSLMLGLDGIWGAVLISLIVSFVAALYLVISKKRSSKDAIPFGPALVIGTFISVALTGM